MKKPFNVRVPVVLAASLAGGIIYSTILAYFRLDAILITIPTAVMLFACIFLCIFTKRSGPVIIILLSAALFVAGALYLYFIFLSYVRTDAYVNNFVQIKGKVVECGVTTGGKNYIVVKNASVYGERMGGRVMAFLEENSGEYCSTGYDVTFYGYVSKESFFSGGAVNYRVTDGIKYYCTAHDLRGQYHFSLLPEINKALESALYNNVAPESAAVCFGLLTGKTAGISPTMLNAFRYGGVAHIFAVSGLHVGLIYGALSFILKRSGVNKYFSSAIKIAVIIFYSGICGFSPSSVRAVVMCSVMAVSSCLYRKYDSWNAVSIAAIILLLVNPTYMFDVGFILSFSAVLGIILLSKNISRIFFFLPSKISGAIAVTLSAQIATVPVLMMNFGYVSAAGLFLNVIFIPLVSVFYVVLFVCALISVIIAPVAPYLLVFACAPIGFLTGVITWLGFENSIISIDVGYWFYLPFLLLFIAISDKFNFRRLLRLIPVGIFATVTVTLLVVKLSVHVDTVTFNTGFTGGSICIKTEKGNVLAVSENYQGSVSYAGSVDALVILGGDYSLDAYFSLGVKTDKLFMRGGVLNIYPSTDVEVTTVDKFEVFGVKFEYVKNCLFIEFDGVNFALVTEGDDKPYGDMPQNTDFNLYCYADEAGVLYAGQSQFDLTYCGNISYTLKDGDYSMKGVIPKER